MHSTSFIAVLAAFSPALALEAEGHQNAPRAENPSPVFYFRDQSKVTGQPLFEYLEVETSYGTLRVPREHLIQVRFARRLPAGLRERIRELVAQLGSEDFDERESASEALAQIGPPALDAVRKGLKSENEEVKSRCEDLEKKLAPPEEKAPSQAEDLLPPLAGSEDEVVTEKMTIKGAVAGESFAIKSRYGDLMVATAALAGIVFRAREGAKLKLDVQETFQPPRNWLDTKFDLARGERFKLAASGQVSVSNYSVVSTPEGVQGYPNTFGGFPSLALVGKIGKGGNAFLVGANYKGKAGAEGRLYLAIVPFVWNAAGASGSYQVKLERAGR